ncbi:MAG TPA: class I SAM-dependent methyltransferase [Actinokineospora sp.]|nr:class I SAM-dependent methyltransferase [Actinokineospora sp.]
MLDVGCGPGYLTRPGRRDRPVGAGDRTGPAHPVGGNREFRVGRAEALDAADGEYDVVLSCLVPHHIPEQPRATAIAEMARVLRPGGRLLVARSASATRRRSCIASAR